MKPPVVATEHTWSRSPRVVPRVVAWAVLCGVFPRAVLAQQGASSAPAADHHVTCLDTIPASAMTRVIVYAHPVLLDSADLAALPAAAYFTEGVVQQLPVLLGAPGDTLPNGEPLVRWRRLPRPIRVTAFRDGRVTWRSYPGGSHAATPGAVLAPGTRLLLHAADSAWTVGGERFQWPPGEIRDSIVFDIRLATGVVDRAGHASTLRLRAPVPAFTVRRPWEESARVVRRPSLTYPVDNQARGVYGTVTVQFVVDTSGHPDMTTFREIWNSPRPRPRGWLRNAYDTFVAAARGALPTAVYEPARIGGCPVRQLVEQPFTFRFSDR